MRNWFVLIPRIAETKRHDKKPKEKETQRHKREPHKFNVETMDLRKTEKCEKETYTRFTGLEEVDEARNAVDG